MTAGLVVVLVLVGRLDVGRVVVVGGRGMSPSYTVPTIVGWEGVVCVVVMSAPVSSEGTENNKVSVNC